MKSALAWFAARFRAEGNAARAAGEKAYLKSELRFHGVTAAQLHRAGADFCRAHPQLTRRELRALAEAAFDGDWFDLRSAALTVAERRVDRLLAADAAWLLALARRAANWAQVDWISTRILGALVEKYPGLTRSVRRWARDRDFWVRRASLLSLLLPMRRGGGDFALFAELAAPMLDEKEFFIRKAIGWILREVSKKRPELTFAFLREHRARLSGLTLREGARRLPASLRMQL